MSACWSFTLPVVRRPGAFVARHALSVSEKESELVQDVASVAVEAAEEVIAKTTEPPLQEDKGPEVTEQEDETVSKRRKFGRVRHTVFLGNLPFGTFFC